jgi:cysteine desulfurase
LKGYPAKAGFSSINSTSQNRRYLSLAHRTTIMKIYLDYNATTPVDKDVVNAMQPYLGEYFGNPSSAHSFGTITKKAVENARKQVAALINCQPNEIIFTSGGTESNNYAIKGFAYANEHKGNHI